MTSNLEPPPGDLPGNLHYLLEEKRLKRGAATPESIAGSGRGHHEVAFPVAAALGGEELKDLVADSTEVGILRHGSMYDPRKATAEDRDHALGWMRRTLPAIRRAILDKSPDLSERLETFPPKRQDSNP